MSTPINLGPKIEQTFRFGRLDPIHHWTIVAVEALSHRGNALACVARAGRVGRRLGPASNRCGLADEVKEIRWRGKKPGRRQIS